MPPRTDSLNLLKSLSLWIFRGFPEVRQAVRKPFTAKPAHTYPHGRGQLRGRAGTYPIPRKPWAIFIHHAQSSKILDPPLRTMLNSPSNSSAP